MRFSCLLCQISIVHMSGTFVFAIKSCTSREVKNTLILLLISCRCYVPHPLLIPIQLIKLQEVEDDCGNITIYSSCMAYICINLIHA